jgi:hypothetical protein
MLKNLLIISIASTFFLACKSNKETAASAEKTTTEQTKTSEVKDQPVTSSVAPEVAVKETTMKVDSVKEDVYRFTVVFFSKGEGTENKYMTAFEDFIGVFAGKVGKNIDYEKTGWGREGETDYCLRLNELTPQEQADFIVQTKEVLKGAKLVHVYENQPCMHKPKR